MREQTNYRTSRKYKEKNLHPDTIMPKFRSILALFYIVFLCSCESLFNKPAEVAFVEVTDAVFLGVDNSKDLDQEQDYMNNLIKIPGNDLQAEPEIVDLLGPDKEKIDPSGIWFNAMDVILLSEQYLAVIGDFRFTLKGSESHSNAFLVNNVTGAVYDLVYEYQPTDMNIYLGGKYHQQDKYGNIYFRGEGIKRLVFSGEEEVSVEHYMDYWDYSLEDGYFVDSEGNIFFDRGQRVKLASGGIIETGLIMTGVNGFDGNLYAFNTIMDESDELKSQIKVGSVMLQDQTVSFTPIDSVALIPETNQYSKYYPDDQEGIHILFPYLLLSVQQEGITEYPGLIGLAFDEESRSLYKVLQPDNLIGKGILMGVESSHLWYDATRNGEGFYSVSLKNYTRNEEEGTFKLAEATLFELPSSYTIQECRFNEQHVIEFRAYDLQAEKKIRGFISQENGLEWYEEESKGTLTLKRIR